VQLQSRVIVMMRHASAVQVGPTDLERELSAEGHADAGAAGTWLAGRRIVPDSALVSAATRTRQTWAAMAAAAGWALEATFDRGLYSAGPETALDLMRATPEDARSLLVIGHNPTIATLAQLLDGGGGDEEAANEMATGYPAGALAVMAYDGKWADLDAELARVTAFHVARA
jgi:phosphohistidine phosphatase